MPDRSEAILIASTNASRPSKKRILTVCVKLFLEQGYKKTTVAQIVQQASVSNSIFQNIFRAKDGVLTELAQFMFSNQFAMARSTAGTQLPPIYVYAVETAIQMTLTELNENLREIYIEAYTQKEALDYIFRETAKELQQIFGPYLPGRTARDFYDMEIGSASIMRGCEGWQIHCYREVLPPDADENTEPELVTCGLPQDRENLAWNAAEAFYARIGKKPEGLEIFINKRIPLEAGLGGGSADAAAVLRALNRAYDSPLSIPALCELGAQVGSDVPFCVMGGTALVEGKGELLTRLPPAPEFFVVICKPDFSVSTPELYQALDETFIEKRPDQKVMQLNLQKGDLLGIGGSLCNVFEPVVMQKYFDINYIRSMMYTYGAYGAQMTGSGSAVFGIYDSFEYATVACTMLKDKYSQIFLAKTV